MISDSVLFPGAFQLGNFLNLLWTSFSMICTSLWLITSLHSHVLFSIYFAKGLYDASHSHSSFQKSVMLSSFVTVFSSFYMTVWKISSGHLHFTGNGVVHVLIPLVLLSVSLSSPSTLIQLLQCYDMRVRFFFPPISIDLLFNFSLFTSPQVKLL